MKPALYALCSLVLHLAPASASPSEISQYLLRTPVSMITYGVNALERLLDEASNELGGVNFFSVNYDHNADIIRIEPWCLGCGLEATGEACGKLINLIRSAAAVTDGEPADPRGSRFSHWFEQVGWAGEPKELRQQIDKMFVISVWISAKVPTPADGQLIKCEAPLLGTGYTVKHP